MFKKSDYFDFLRKRNLLELYNLKWLKEMGERFATRYIINDIAAKIYSPFPFSFSNTEQYLRILTQSLVSLSVILYNNHETGLKEAIKPLRVTKKLNKGV